MGITPLAFTGVSKFSDDFQSILSRAVKIASLPAQALQSDQQVMLSQKVAFSDLRDSVSALSSSLAKLGTLRTGGALSATSDSSAVTFSLGAGATAGAYQISDITSLAQAAISTSTVGLDTANATAVAGVEHKIQLVVGSSQQTLTLTDATDNLNGLRDAINAAGMGVTASVIDTGADTQRYFLTLTADTTGSRTISLRTTPDDEQTNLLSVTRPGANAMLKVNGQFVSSPDNLISSVIPGVSMQLNATAVGQTINFSIGLNRAPVVTAINAFVSAYNGLVGKLDAQTGQTGGMLSGDPLIGEINSRLRELTGQRGDGSIGSLSDFGITLDSNGVMGFDSLAVSFMSTGNLNSLFNYLGDSTTGLASQAAKFSQYSDPVNGLIQSRVASYTESDARMTTQINDINARVATMQATMMARLQAADALLAQLESQQSMLTSTIDSLNFVTNGKSA
jgi:flagellar hook-associated protein 2